jgi:hypothetical protein
VPLVLENREAAIGVLEKLSVIRFATCASAVMALLLTAACREEKPPAPVSASGPASSSVPVSASVPTSTSDVVVAAGPSEVVRRYYEAIRSGRYDSAYAMWDGAGKASQQTAEQFARGFANTAQTFVSIGDSVSIEGAAGSQYATVPVTVDATLRGGGEQHFVGTYTLRRAMVDGATAAQRRWRIYSAHLEKR